jgi:hypothetical protein
MFSYDDYCYNLPLFFFSWFLNNPIKKETNGHVGKSKKRKNEYKDYTEEDIRAIDKVWYIILFYNLR